MAVPGYVLKNQRTTLERAEKFISPIYFTDVNLRGRLYSECAPVKSLLQYKAPGYISFNEAILGNYTEANVGDSFGPTWSTYWFRLEIEIPASWEGKEVHLMWNTESEALLWKDNTPLQGFTNAKRRNEYVLSKKVPKSQQTEIYYVEMACNELFVDGNGSQIAPPDLNRYFTLSQCNICVIDADIRDLLRDFEVMYGIAKDLPENSNRAYQALYTVNEMINSCDFSNRSSFERVRKMARDFLHQKNGESQHWTCAVGHCHIDCAWLWPYAETIRKCARGFSSTIRLLEEYPQFTFVCSQAQQYAWVKENYPPLYGKIRCQVKESRFIPVGGTWCEPDGNIPSGESFIRQFLYGQKFFEREFGVRCKEFWLPDTFGYSAQIPQLINHCGMNRFLTQKLSWNLVNKFPHHTFWWAGIDGTKILAHFPPGDSYGMKGNVKELLHTVTNFQDKGRSNCSMYLYGHGNSGQGPTSEMIERLTRLQDVDGVPKVEMSSPDKFFSHVEAHEADNLCSWTGELYFEHHHGTYTTQAKMKKQNRFCEFLLRDVEIVCSATWCMNKFSYPEEELVKAWKLLLLNQFHDVLPGSSINMVYKDAMKYYKEINQAGTLHLTEALKNLFEAKKASTKGTAVINTLSWPRKEVVAISVPKNGVSHPHKPKISECQVDTNGDILALVAAPSCGYGPLVAEDASVAVEVINKDGIIILENCHLVVKIDPLGRITSLLKKGIDGVTFREAVSEGQYLNQLVIFEDIPLHRDAWDVMDYHLETRKTIEDVLDSAHVVKEGPIRAAMQVSLKISDKSYIKQIISLDADCPYVKVQNEVEWYESHRFLKVEFPVNVHAPHATYEIQYGHLQRNTHFNNSWDWAKFEVCGHKWADVSEYDWGVSVLNDCKYGWFCIDNVLRMSLLRSPKAPDEKADMGSQSFAYAIMPHTGSFQDAGVIQAAYQLNSPLLVHHGNMTDNLLTSSFVQIEKPEVILAAMKKAEEEDSLVMRFYEAYGGRTSSKVKVNLPFKQVQLCNGLEEVQDNPLTLNSQSFTLTFKPFQIISVKLTF